MSPTAEFTAYPGYNPDPCYHAKDHDSADLCAQWRAAIAAEKATHEARRANLFAIITSALSLVTVIGLIVTIWQTSGALREARRGNRLSMKANARATRQAVSGAAETAKALEHSRLSAEAAISAADSAKQALSTSRAWICPADYITGIFADGTVDGKAVREGIIIQAHWMNFGQTPAINVLVFRDFQMIGVDDPIPNFTSSLNKEMASAGAPNKPYPLSAIVLDDEQTAALRQQHAHVAVYFHISYEDIFNPGIIRECESCVRVRHGGGVMQAPDGRMVDAINFAFEGPQNRLT